MEKSCQISLEIILEKWILIILIYFRDIAKNIMYSVFSFDNLMVRIVIVKDSEKLKIVK